jgi:predicted TIM-barrel enzyme/AraC-like DNA-binding protein
LKTYFGSFQEKIKMHSWEFERNIILENLRRQIKVSMHLIGVACGSGLAAKRARRGGADMILALSSGRFRQMGQGSLAGYMPFTNSNKLVMDFGSKELVPAVREIPVIFGLNAADPSIIMEQYIKKIYEAGFTGINNYPTVGLIDGKFREAIEEQGISYDLEVEAIRIASLMGIFTLAFVFDCEQAVKMLHAGADVICVHLGLTRGGELGAKKVLSLEAGARLAEEIFNLCDKIRPQALKMVYGGPVHTPMDVEYIYGKTAAQGYIGGSAFERTPSEIAITEKTREFKTAGNYDKDMLLQKMLRGIKRNDYVDFVKEYVCAHYMKEISFSDLASISGISRTHLSNLFKEETGLTFPSYLNSYRINKACELIEHEKIPLYEVSLAVGYKDYSYFSRTFQRIMKMTPKAYCDRIRKM